MLAVIRRMAAVSAPRIQVAQFHSARLIAAEDAAEGSAPAREQGTVKWFSKEKGFGFISRADGTDVFVHFTNLRGSGFRTLEEGQAVDFTVAAGKKGQEARDVGAR